MSSSRLRTRILGVVVGAATVKPSLSFTLIRNVRVSVGVGRMSTAAASSTRMSAGAATVDAQQYADFIREKVCTLYVGRVRFVYLPKIF